MTTTQALKASKSELETVLANHRVRMYPSLYAGHYEDALFFVRHHLGPTKADLLLAIEVRGLATADGGGLPQPGWSIRR